MTFALIIPLPTFERILSYKSKYFLLFTVRRIYEIYLANLETIITKFSLPLPFKHAIWPMVEVVVMETMQYGNQARNSREKTMKRTT